MKKLRVAIFSFLMCSGGLAQAPPLEWQKSFGGTGQEMARTIQQTTDGGYIVAGNTNSDDGDVTGYHDGSDFWMVKLSSEGGIEWQKALGGFLNDVCYDIEQTTDNGYILCGETHSSDGDATDNNGQRDFWIVKVTSAGNIDWQKSLGGSENDIAHSVQQTSDGGYIVAGYSSSSDGDVTSNQGANDFWIVKITSTGALEWEKSFGGTDAEIAGFIKQTPDGGYVLLGTSISNDGDITGGHGSFDCWLAKLSASGSLEWEKSLGGSGADEASAILVTADSGFFVCASSTSADGDLTENAGDMDMWVVKLNSTGDIEWQKSMGGSQKDRASAAHQTTDGGYVISVRAKSSDGDITWNNGAEDFWIVKLSDAGDLEWQRSVGGSDQDVPYGICQSADGGYVIAGYSYSNDGDISGNNGLIDYCIVKLVSLVELEDIKESGEVHVYPNPCDGPLMITVQSDNDMNYEVTISSLSGVVISSATVHSSVLASGFLLENQNLASGVYLLTLSNGQSVSVTKLVKR